MSLLVLLLTLAMIGLVAWLLVTYVPMPSGVKTVIIIVAVVACVAYALQAFGVRRFRPSRRRSRGYRKMTDQAELPGMPEETALGVAAKKFVAEKEAIAAAKLRSVELEKEILTNMKLENVPRFKISAGGENFEFEIVPGVDGLRCAKITKTVKKPVSQPEEKEAVAV